MAKPLKRFVCQSCGAVTTKWSGRCESCGECWVNGNEHEYKFGGKKLFGCRVFFACKFFFLRIMNANKIMQCTQCCGNLCLDHHIVFWSDQKYAEAFLENSKYALNDISCLGMP